MSKKYNQLNSDQRYDLWRWVDQNRDVVLNASDSEAATIAGSKVGFMVTDANILAAREKFGIRKSGGRPAAAKVAELELRVSVLEDRVRAIEAAFSVNLPRRA